MSETCQLTLKDRLQQYLRSNFDRESLHDSLNYDNTASVLIDVAKKFDLKSGTQRPDEEYHQIVKQAIDNYLSTPSADNEGQDKAHNLGNGHDPNKRYETIVNAVNTKYY
jgi:hypothetical protein